MATGYIQFTQNGEYAFDISENTSAFNIELMIDSLSSFGGGTLKLLRREHIQNQYVDKMIESPMSLSWETINTYVEITGKTSSLNLLDFAHSGFIVFKLEGATSPNIEILLLNLGRSFAVVI